MPFDISRVADILVCPASHSKLVLDGENLVATCPESRRSYPILDGIPRLLVSESTVLSVEDWQTVMDRANAADAQTDN